jgi:hypothetical protein
VLTKTTQISPRVKEGYFNLQDENTTDFCSFVLMGLHVRHTNTAQIIWRGSNFTGGGRPQVPFCALFKARTGT